MLLKSSNILPLLNSEESSSDFSTVMFYLLVWWIHAFIPEKSDVKGCGVIEMRLRGEMRVWRQEGDERHITIQHFRHHTPPHRSLISPSSFNINLYVFFSVLCFFKLWCVCMSSAVVWLKAPPVVFWEGERCAQAYCYSSRCLCVWSALIAELCFWCSCFALASTWLHIQGLFAAGSSTMSSVVKNNSIFTAAVLIYHTREMITEILT